MRPHCRANHAEIEQFLHVSRSRLNSTQLIVIKVKLHLLYLLDHLPSGRPNAHLATI